MNQFEEILEIVRDFNGEITVSQLLSADIDFDVEDSQLIEQLEEHFKRA